MAAAASEREAALAATPTDGPTIFDKIIRKEIPSTVVYEDEKVHTYFFLRTSDLNSHELDYFIDSFMLKKCIYFCSLEDLYTNCPFVFSFFLLVLLIGPVVLCLFDQINTFMHHDGWTLWCFASNFLEKCLTCIMEWYHCRDLVWYFNSAVLLIFIMYAIYTWSVGFCLCPSVSCALTVLFSSLFLPDDFVFVHMLLSYLFPILNYYYFNSLLEIDAKTCKVLIVCFTGTESNLWKKGVLY